MTDAQRASLERAFDVGTSAWEPFELTDAIRAALDEIDAWRQHAREAGEREAHLAREIERLDFMLGVRGNMLRYIAFVTTGDEAGDAQLGVDRMKAALDLAKSALPDAEIAGPDGTGYKYAWDELTDDEQAWVKDVRRRL
jgi:hypothetical protein